MSASNQKGSMQKHCHSGIFLQSVSELLSEPAGF